jgi:hypothetical protein
MHSFFIIYMLCESIQFVSHYMEIESVWGIGSSIIFTDYFFHKNIVCWALANPDYAQVTNDFLFCFISDSLLSYIL